MFFARIAARPRKHHPTAATTAANAVYVVAAAVGRGVVDAEAPAHGTRYSSGRQAVAATRSACRTFMPVGGPGLPVNSGNPDEESLTTHFRFEDANVSADGPFRRPGTGLKP